MDTLTGRDWDVTHRCGWIIATSISRAHIKPRAPWIVHEQAVRLLAPGVDEKGTDTYSASVSGLCGAYTSEFHMVYASPCLSRNPGFSPNP
ncbi:hypothetical protein GCM10025857_20220 [Alicyclobacillus contaminans]|nr:hypothetical protein GCM10025857_20220 [Alicyclobacillus contaminans]